MLGLGKSISIIYLFEEMRHDDVRWHCPLGNERGEREERSETSQRRRPAWQCCKLCHDMVPQFETNKRHLSWLSQLGRVKNRRNRRPSNKSSAAFTIFLQSASTGVSLSTLHSVEPPTSTASVRGKT
jgi:hypothetical protein